MPAAQGIAGLEERAAEAAAVRSLLEGVEAVREWLRLVGGGGGVRVPINSIIHMEFKR